jgi:hypothetical protein
MNASNNSLFYDDIDIKFNIDHLFTMIDIPVTIFGTFTNLVNIIIFSHKTFKDKIFTYLLFHSTAEFLYLFMMNFIPFPYCGVYCDFTVRNSRISILIELVIDDYLTSCLAIFNILLEVFISLQRYSLLSSISCFRFNFLNMNSSPYYVLIIIGIISLLYYLPIFLIFEISQIDDTMIPNRLKMNGEKYFVKTSTQFSIEHESVQEYFEFIVNFFRGPVCMAMLTLINLLTLLKFRKQIKKKIKIKSNYTLIFSISIKFVNFYTIIERSQ